MSNDMYFKDDEDKKEIDTSKMTAHELCCHNQKFEIPYTIKLSYPYEFGVDNLVEEITFSRRLTTSDLMTFPADNQQLGHLVKLVSKTTNTATAQLNKMDSCDLMLCIDVVSTFLSKPPVTGSKLLHT